jgi:hypothetical protein
MRALVLAMGLAACASVPGPKRPDESRRIPVNRTVPPELSGEPTNKPSDLAPRRRTAGAEVDWR